MRSGAALILPALVAASPMVLPRGSTPDPTQITITDSSYSGSGCPQGTVSTTVSDDRTVITYGFDSFQTYIGPGTAPADHSKNCQLHVNLKYPGGFQYAVVDATYHGYARLDAGVTGNFYSTYFFSQDASKTSTTKTTVTGGGDLLTGQIYTKDDKVETTSTIWSPCGTNGILNINNRIALTSSKTTAAGELSNDDATVAITQQLHVSWRACTPSSSGDSGAGSTIGLGTPSTEITY